jgi:hypothetical protein
MNHANTMRTTLILAAAIGVLGGCARKADNQAASSKETQPAPVALSGPEIVQGMVAAHGGLAAWRAAPTVSFIDSWGRPGQPVRRSIVVVEQSSRRAYIDMPEKDAAMAWDGKEAWSTHWPPQSPVRFRALLTYYFADLPWLTQDPGVKLEDTGMATLRGDSTQCATVMMTFAPGTGDTPKDYYRLYIDPTTHRLKACDYVVTYKALMGEGESSSPEHCLVYDDFTTVNGLVVPTHFTIYEGDKLLTGCAISNWSFSTPFDETRMSMPDSAVVDSSTP